MRGKENEMGMNVLSLFDGMSCGRLALDKAGIPVNTYVASEVKPFAIRHTSERYPDTVQAGDVTALHYDGQRLYKNCKRFLVVNDLSVLNPRDDQRNASLIKEENGVTYIDIAHIEFEHPGTNALLSFDETNKTLLRYKDKGLFVNAANLSEEEVFAYRQSGHEILPNGEIVKWEKGELVFEGRFDMLIGGSPCQDFSILRTMNRERYGLEGSKSRLFFDYLRLLKEVSPRYFFLENVKMRAESKEMLDAFLGVDGICVNSSDFSTQNRQRIYWTNLTDQAPVSTKAPAEISFKNRRLRTLPHLEWAIYVHKFPGSYFGYAEGTPEKEKEEAFLREGKGGFGKFTFDDERTDSTNVLGSYVEGTKEDIRRMVRFTDKKYDLSDKSLSATTKHADHSVAYLPDLSFTDEDAKTIARMNAWAREGYEAFVMRKVTDREFAEEIHRQMEESLAVKSPSRDGMRYGKPVLEGEEVSSKDRLMFKCKDITDEEKMLCITRKQDRCSNSGNIAFGPYYRFLTKFEICDGQTVPYAFLGDMSYTEIQDVCGDGWTVDVIAAFFQALKEKEKIDKQSKEEKSVSKTKVREIWNEKDEKSLMAKAPERKEVPSGNTEVLIPVSEVLAIMKKVSAGYDFPVLEEFVDAVEYEMVGFDIEKVGAKDAPSIVLEKIKEEVRLAKEQGQMNEEMTKKAMWLLDFYLDIYL